WALPLHACFRSIAHPGGTPRRYGAAPSTAGLPRQHVLPGSARLPLAARETAAPGESLAQEFVDGVRRRNQPTEVVRPASSGLPRRCSPPFFRRSKRRRTSIGDALAARPSFSA